MYKRPAALLWLAIIILYCPVAAQAARMQQGSTVDRAADGATSEPDPNKPPGTAKGLPATVEREIEDRLRALEQIIERQQREIQALRELIEKRDAAPAGERASSAVEIKPAEIKSAEIETAVETGRSLSAQPASTGSSSVEQAESNQKRIDELYKKFGPIRFSGDVRLRTETFSSQGFDSPLGQPFRKRMRIRARLALDGVINKNFDWGLRLSSGPVTDVNSTNQTLTDFFERKQFSLDRAFIRYDSKGERVGVQLVAGKFEPTFRRTQMIWDEDVRVEGASEAIYFKTESSLKQIKLVAFQLPFDEEPSAKDGWVYGGQMQTDWQLSPEISATFDVAHYNWNRPDLVLQALVPFAGNGTSDGQAITLSTTNSVIRDASGRPIGFLANFNLFNILGSLTWEASSQWPVTGTFDFVRNLTGRIDDEENGLWAGVQVGHYRERGDWVFKYTYARIERDAVLSPFNFSDILQTNSRTHIPSVGYQIANGVTITWNGIFTQRINRLVESTSPNRYLKRMQFDIVYQF
jgi:hypothetical protein